MDMTKFYNIGELESNLLIDNQSIGTFIGISDQSNKCWKFAIYLGNEKMCILYEKERGIIAKQFFQTLCSLSKTNLLPRHLFELDSPEIINYISHFVDKECFEFYIYKLNIFQTTKENKIKMYDFLKVIEFNLSEFETLDEGDIISFDRSLYHHHAILTDKTRMIVTHRSGEPENGGASTTIIGSLIGMPTEKALVSEDHCIEIGGYRRLTKSNEPYDNLHMPRTKEEIVQEAQRRIGERGYSITRRNCQHFASECRNGTSFAPEVQGVINGIQYSAIFGALSLGAFAIYSKLSKNSNTNERVKKVTIENNEE